MQHYKLIRANQLKFLTFLNEKFLYLTLNKNSNQKINKIRMFMKIMKNFNLIVVNLLIFIIYNINFLNIKIKDQSKHE